MKEKLGIDSQKREIHVFGIGTEFIDKLAVLIPKKRIK
jgi:hypothetical protein